MNAATKTNAILVNNTGYDIRAWDAQLAHPHRCAVAREHR
jgi:hypothetical protein